MRFLVCGANGFIGSWTIAVLADQGHAVTGICRQSAATHWRIAWLKKRCPAVRVFALETMTADAALDRLGHHDAYQAVINCVGDGMTAGRQRTDQLFSANIALTLELCGLAHCLQIPRLVTLGSGFEYGFSSVLQRFTENAPRRPTSPYGLSKILGHELARHACRLAGLQLVHLRVFGVIGPGDNAHRLVPLTARNLMNHQPVALTDGHQVRDFLSVSDVAEAIALAAWVNLGTVDAVFNVSSGQGTSVRAVVDMIRRQLDAAPSLLRWGSLRPTDTQGAFWIGDSTRFREATGWAPKVSLADAIQASIDWERLARRL